MNIIELSAEGIKKAEELISYEELIQIIQPFKTDIIYLGGSLIEGQIESLSMGMGNELSDLDIYIIREHNNFVNTDFVYNQSVKKTYFINNVLGGIDVEVFDRDFINNLNEILLNKKINPSERCGNFFSDGLADGGSYRLINSFLNRLKYSICLYNEDGYNELKSQINFNRFLEIKKANQLVIIDNIFPDIIGNIRLNQLDVALYCSRELFLEALEYILANEKIFVDRKKWVVLKFRNLVEQEKMYTTLWHEYGCLFLSELSSFKKMELVINSAINTIKDTLEDSLFTGGTL